MPLKLSARSEIPPFRVMEVMRAAFERERSGAACFHMEVGQPGTGAPDGVLRAVEAAIRADKLGYTDALGVPELREAIARHYADTYDVDLDPGRIAVTTGSSAAFVLSFLCAFEIGDRVALVSPGYPCYRAILAALGCEVVTIETGPDERYQPTPALVRAAHAEAPLSGLIVASPSNPTGTMIPTGQFKQIVDFCGEAGIRLVSDEIYHGITYDRAADTALSFTDDAIIVNSFSKYFSMTGWRVGWLVIPTDMVRAIERLGQNLYISPPTISQVAAAAAFDCHEELQANVERYRLNRDLLLNELPSAGFTRLAPSDGAFYIYADVSDRTQDSVAFCNRMLTETGVAATPGVDFDPRRGHTDVRFSYSGATEEMAAAARALRGWS